MNSFIKPSALIAAVLLTVTAGGIPSLVANDDHVLRAGAATSNITPPLGRLRVGSFAPYPSLHVHDELHARCLVLSDGETTLAMVVSDLVGLHRSVSVEARRLIMS